jgi:hypothetical protein
MGRKRAPGVTGLRKKKAGWSLAYLGQVDRIKVYQFPTIVDRIVGSHFWIFRLWFKKLILPGDMKTAR